MLKWTPDLLKDWKPYYQPVGSIVVMKRTYWKYFLQAQNIESLQAQSTKHLKREKNEGTCAIIFYENNHRLYFV